MAPYATVIFAFQALSKLLKVLARYVVLKTNAVTMEGASLDVATLVSFCQTMLQNAMRGAGRQDASRGMNLCAARDVSRRKIPTARHKRWSKWSWRSRTKFATYSVACYPTLLCPSKSSSLFILGSNLIHPLPSP